MFLDRFAGIVISGPQTPVMVSHPMSIVVGSEFGKDYWGAKERCAHIDMRCVNMITLLFFGNTEAKSGFGWHVEG
jgi:hypothetical protein